VVCDATLILSTFFPSGLGILLPLRQQLPSYRYALKGGCLRSRMLDGTTCDFNFYPDMAQEGCTGSVLDVLRPSSCHPLTFKAEPMTD
jgi:hypothetical protein